MSDREKVKAEMRDAMPHVASVVDLFRAAGVEVRVTAVIEGGRTVGSLKALAQLEDAFKPERKCKNCLWWRKEIGDGAGICTAKNRPIRSWVADWPDHPGCELFEISGGCDVCGD